MISDFISHERYIEQNINVENWKKFSNTAFEGISRVIGKVDLWLQRNELRAGHNDSKHFNNIDCFMLQVLTDVVTNVKLKHLNEILRFTGHLVNINQKMDVEVWIYVDFRFITLIRLYTINYISGRRKSYCHRCFAEAV